MVISIHQPDYIPYLGYFYKMAKSDIFVFLDDVQFSKSNMHNWNTIVSNKTTARLRIPVDYHFGDDLRNVKCKYQLGWVDKHLATIRDAYKEADYFNCVYPILESLFTCEHSSLAELNIAVNKAIAVRMGITPRFVISSNMEKLGNKENLVIDICKRLDGDRYISGNGARDYQDKEHFTSAGVELCYTDYEPFEYKQLADQFIPNMSVIDYVMNCGWKNPFK